MKVKTIHHYLLAGLLSFAGLLLVFTPGRALAADSDVTPVQVGPSGATVDSTQPDAIESSVIKIYSTVRYPDPYHPWTKQTPTELTGSGVVLKGKRILTNAHVVQYASQVQVETKAGGMLSATVEAIAPGMDLAVLKLDDDSFFDTHPALAWAPGTPQIQDPVEVYGYPMGGDNLSITKGIVSRVEFAAYNYPDSGLRIQIDAAINPGNSGGPAIVNGKMIGIAFSRLGGEAENIGYIIPCEEINLFLKGVDAGNYDGKPCMFDECQKFSNPTLRSFLQVDDSVQGVIVSNPASTNKNYPLKKWDLITQIGDTPVDDEGMVNLDNDLRVFFKYLVQRIATNGVIPLTVIRDGRQVHIKLPVANHRPLLISELSGGYPSYFVYGPAVFSGVTADFIEGMTGSARGGTMLTILAVSGSPLLTRMGDQPAFEGEQLVIVCSPLFPDRLSNGFANPIGMVVKSVNGIPIKNLKHLVQVLRDSRDKYIQVEFYGADAPILVFPRAEMADDTDSILTDNDIRSQGSPDVMAVWNGSSK